MIRRAWRIAAVCAIAGCGAQAVEVPRAAGAHVQLRLDGVMSIAPKTPFAALKGLTFGGVSGLAYDARHGELIGVCDESRNWRLFRMRLTGDPLRVAPVGVVRLDAAPGAPARLDAEGLAILPDGHLLIASEGGGSGEPRQPPALVEYTRDGRFVRQLPVPEKFIPTPSGRQTSGVRANEAFESLTLTPDGRRLYTGTESALVQDEDAASFEHGARSRLIEYERREQGYVPAREFAYDVDAIPRPSFTPGIAINGLVELLALNEGALLALERSFVEDADRPGRGANRIRLYRASLERATDVSGWPSLRDRAVTPVSKTLLLDLGALAGLPEALRVLDNFEGLALLPSRHGAPSLLIVSDDNFSETERTWFVRLAWKY